MCLALLLEHGCEKTHNDEFRARLKASQGPRSRTLDIDANSTLEAEREALTRAGVGWVLLDLEERKL